MLWGAVAVTDVAVPDDGLILERVEGGWRLAGDDAVRFGLVNDYLGYLADRNYSPRTIRTYGFGLLAFCRWLADEDLELGEVSTDVLLRFLKACRTERVDGRRGGPNVVDLEGRRPDVLSPATINISAAMSAPIPKAATRSGTSSVVSRFNSCSWALISASRASHLLAMARSAPERALARLADCQAVTLQATRR